MPIDVLDNSLTVLIHGSSKVGKSTLSVTAPAPRLYLDVESASRFLPIKRVYWDPHKEAPPECDGTWDTCVVLTRDWGTVEKAYQWLASGKHCFKSLIIDSISELQSRFLEQMAGRQQLTQAQWGDAFRKVSGLVRDIRDLTMHPVNPVECVVMTAITKHVDGKWKPYVQGQLQAVLPYLLDAVLYMWVDMETNELSNTTQEVRKVLTRPTPEFEAGERVGGVWPTVVANPDLSVMKDMIFGNPEAPAPPPEPAPTESPEMQAQAAAVADVAPPTPDLHNV